MNFGDLLQVINNILTVLVLVAIALGFAFKTWIREWIKGRLRAELTRELDESRHKLARELEGYKGALLKDLEDYKANIDIRRSIALKMADARLDALRRLTVNLDHFTNEALTMCCAPVALKNMNMALYNAASSKVRETLRDAEIFLPLEFVGQISGAQAGLATLATTCTEQGLVLAQDDQQLMPVRSTMAAVHVRLRDTIHADFPAAIAAVARG